MRTKLIVKELIDELAYNEQYLRDQISRIEDRSEREHAWYGYYRDRFCVTGSSVVAQLYGVLRRERKRENRSRRQQARDVIAEALTRGDRVGVRNVITESLTRADKVS